MNLFKRIRIKFWRTAANFKHRYTKKYAKVLGVNISDSARFTGVPDFSTEPWLVSIGDHTLITQNVRFMTHDGAVSVVRSMSKKYKDIMKFGKIVVEDHCFIGANSMIMPSVHIGSHSIVAACSCVTKDIPAGEVWGGVPARKICTVQEYADKLYQISLSYNNQELLTLNKKDCSTMVAEIYWSDKHC